jgi:hypothetical protein
VTGAQTQAKNSDRERAPRRRARTISLAAIALALVGSPAAQALTAPGVIRITQRQVEEARINRGRTGPRAGDIDVVRDLLYNTRITPQAIGHGELVCTFTGTTSRICSGVYFLPKGKIIVGGSLLYRQFYELAVLGGTGLYSNARGTLTVTNIKPSHPATDLLLFRLVP